MFSKLTKRDLLQLLIIVIFIGAAGYYYANVQARNQLWQQTYPIRAELSVKNISCSKDSPSWMKNVLIDQTKNNNAPANQIAFIDTKGKLYHCENGYVGQYPVVSDAVNDNTRFRYASITKLWTADAILDLIKQKKLSLDTKLSDVLTEIEKPQDTRISSITIRQLLTHRAGFDRYSIAGNDMFGIGKDICPNHLDELNTIELNFEPDSKTSYSNLGYCLLGAVISRVSNKPYNQIIADNYYFNDTTLKFVSDQRMTNEVDYNYVETGLTGHADIYTAFNYDDLASVAGLSGNAIDLAREVHMMASKPAPNILTIDTASNCNLKQFSECYGYAMQPYQSQKNMPKTYYRSGNLLGLSSWVAVSDNGSVVALLSNGTPNDVKNDGNQLQEKLYGFMNP